MILCHKFIIRWNEKAFTQIDSMKKKFYISERAYVVSYIIKYLFRYFLISL